MINTQERFNKKKELLSIFSGFLCFFLAPFSIEISVGAIDINLPWSIIFPLLVSIAYGKKYALISGISGGVWFPFYLWFDNGYPDLTTSLIYLFIFVFTAHILNFKTKNIFKRYSIKLLTLSFIITLIFFIYYEFLFNLLLKLNPPFWNKNSINNIKVELLQTFFIKDVTVFLSHIIIAEALLKLSFIKRILGLKTYNFEKNNNKIFVYTLLLGLIIWVMFYLLSYKLYYLGFNFSLEILLLFLYFMLFTGIVISRLIMHFSENQIKSQMIQLETEAKYKRLTENAQDVIYRMLLPDGYYEYVSPSSEKMFGFTPQDFYNYPKIISQIIHPDYLEYFRIEWDKLLNNITEPNYEYKIITKKGKEKWLNQRNVFIKNEFGKITAIEGIVTDITERKEMLEELKTKNEKIEAQNFKYEALNEKLRFANEDLKIAKDKAEESNRLKTVFINNMSHEIRTPLNGILGFSEFISQKQLSYEKRKEYSEIIQNSGKKLLKIIDNILEVSKLETTKIKTYDDVINLNEYLYKFYTDYIDEAKDKNLKFELNTQLDDEESCILTDKYKLAKIFNNLLENAFKYTKEGFVEFGYQIKDKFIEFYVKDSGLGISPENQNIIFERFIQETKDITETNSGLGLGLAIAKENAGLLGGNIFVISDKGKGSKFFIKIPYNKADTATSNYQQNDSDNKIPDKYKILIVEDERINYLYLETLLEDIDEINVEVLYAKNGVEAIEICKQFDNIDLVLMDIKMPKMDGFEATKKILEIRPKSIIIAQTAYTSVDDRKKAKAAGCIDLMSKPIKKTIFHKMLNKYLLNKQ